MRIAPNQPIIGAAFTADGMRCNLVGKVVTLRRYLGWDLG